jgi:secernin
VPLQVSQIRLQRSRQLLRDAVDSAGVDVAAAQSVLRDHLEGTFLEGPYFNAARPDFLTLCMHSHPSGFTWGNTASSGVFVLPPDDRPPHLWWAAATPCTSVYIPVFVEAGGVPDVLARAGTADPETYNPEHAPTDMPADGSYWWTFQRLLDAVKGDALGTAFAGRQAQVRDTFDPLETAWRAELDDVLEQAATLRPGDRRAELLASLTRRCVERALAAANGLLDRFTSGAPQT